MIESRFSMKFAAAALSMGLCFAGIAAAEEAGAAAASAGTVGSADAGATKAAVCTACHGVNGNSVNPEWPNLAGQNAVYIREQLGMYKDRKSVV